MDSDLRTAIVLGKMQADVPAEPTAERSIDEAVSEKAEEHEAELDDPRELREPSQLALAEVVARQLDGKVLCVPGRKECSFYLWDETKRIWRADGNAQEVLRYVGNEIREEIAYAKKKYPASTKIKPRTEEEVVVPSKEGAFLDKQLSERGLSAVFRLVKAHPILHADERDFDANPFVVQCANGVIDLRSGTLHAPDPTLKITKLVPVIYREKQDWKTLATRFERFLREAFAKDVDAPTKEEQATIDYVQKVFGYGLTGLMREHRFWIFFGKGRNGKGTLLNTIKRVLDQDIVASASKTTFLTDGENKPIRSDLAVLRGKRLVITDEVGPDAELSTVLKSLVGGGAIPCKLEYSSPIEYQPTFKLILDGNYLPKIPTGDEAMWKRIVSVCFPNSFYGRENRELEDELFAEREGIFKWIVDGAVSYFEEKLATPEHIANAAKNHREMDPMEQFFADRCVLDDEAWASSAELYRAYRTFMEVQGHEEKEIKTKNAFCKGLNSRFDREKCDDVRGYRGIGLKHAPAASKTAETSTASKTPEAPTISEAPTVSQPRMFEENSKF